LENGDIAVGVLAVDDFTSRWRFHGESLGSDGHSPVVADADAGALAEDEGPPRTGGCGSQGPAVFFFGQVPSGLRSATDFAMFFHRVVVAAQDVQEWIGFGQGGNGVGSQQGRKAFLPELVTALDFSLGLRGWSKPQGDTVKAEGIGQLRMAAGQMREEEAVEIDIQAQGQAGGLEGLTQEVQMGQERLPLVELGGDNNAAVIVHQMQQGGLPILAHKPPMGGSIVLPKLADFLGLPAAHGRAFAGRSLWRQVVLQGEAAHGSAVDLVAQAAQALRGDQAIRARRFGLEQPHDQILDGLGPSRASCAAGKLGRPLLGLALAHRFQVTVKELIEPSFGDLQFSGGLGGRAEAIAKLPQDIANERSAEALEELRYFFSWKHDSRSGTTHFILDSPPPIGPWAFPPPRKAQGPKGGAPSPVKL